jgi:hypothetical protein
MSIIRDADGTIYAKVNNSMVRDQLALSGIERGSFTPCSFGEEMERLNITYCDKEGSIQTSGDKIACLDYYDLLALQLAKELESVLNRAAEISVDLAYYDSCCTGLRGIDLLIGVEEMQDAAAATAKRICQIFPAECRQLRINDEPS